MAKKVKRGTAVKIGAVVLAATLLSGTLAVMNLAQSATNLFEREVNDGVRLHDDFAPLIHETDQDKHIYAENYGEAPVIVRIRLTEAMSIGSDIYAGEEAKLEGADGAEKLIDLRTRYAAWEKHVQDGAANKPQPYWTWTMGGEKVYLPTDNRADGNEPDAELADNITKRKVYDGAGAETALTAKTRAANPAFKPTNTVEGDNLEDGFDPDTESAADYGGEDTTLDSGLGRLDKDGNREFLYELRGVPELNTTDDVWNLSKSNVNWILNPDYMTGIADVADPNDGSGYGGLDTNGEYEFMDNPTFPQPEIPNPVPQGYVTNPLYDDGTGTGAGSGNSHSNLGAGDNGGEIDDGGNQEFILDPSWPPTIPDPSWSAIVGNPGYRGAVGEASATGNDNNGGLDNNGRQEWIASGQAPEQPKDTLKTLAVISMAQWAAGGWTYTDAGGGTKTAGKYEIGPFWIGDTDGWYYWGEQLAPGTATGLLLNHVTANQDFDHRWFYGIYAEMQAVTYIDAGKFAEAEARNGDKSYTAPAERLCAQMSGDLIGWQLAKAGLTNDEAAINTFVLGKVGFSAASTPKLALEDDYGGVWAILDINPKTRQLLLLHNAAETNAESQIGAANDYGNSRLSKYLNGDYYNNVLAPTFREKAATTAIGTETGNNLPIYYTNAKVFVLSHYDLHHDAPQNIGASTTNKADGWRVGAGTNGTTSGYFNNASTAAPALAGSTVNMFQRTTSGSVKPWVTVAGTGATNDGNFDTVVAFRAAMIVNY